jgi:hypothetical protein
MCSGHNFPSFSFQLVNLFLRYSKNYFYSVMAFAKRMIRVLQYRPLCPSAVAIILSVHVTAINAGFIE